jgi:uncharacterized phage-associated protein
MNEFPILVLNQRPVCIPMPLGYNVRKAAQVVAFLIREQGGSADMIKTVKLAYMSDRRFLELYDRPILNDDLKCLDNGPIDSATLNYIKGAGSENETAIWSQYVTKVDEAYIFETADPDIYFGELSEVEENVLRETVEKFKSLKPFELVDWIHENCKEWIDPLGTSMPLSYEDVFKALGKDQQKKRADYVNSVRQLAKAINFGS